MALTLDDLRKRKTAVDEVTIHSYDMNLYLVELVVGRNKSMLCEKSGRPIRFRSVEQVKDEMADLPLIKVQLKHKSPFDEMIGNPESAEEPLSIPLFWQPKNT